MWPLDDSRKLFCFNRELFWQWTSNLRDSQAAPGQKYINGWVLGVARIIHWDVSPITPWFLQEGVKTANFGLDFRHRLSFKRYSSETAVSAYAAYTTLTQRDAAWEVILCLVLDIRYLKTLSASGGFASWLLLPGALPQTPVIGSRYRVRHEPPSP